MRIHDYEFTPGWLPTLAALALVYLFVNLGFWQLGRGDAKDRREHEHATRADDGVLTLDANTPEYARGISGGVLDARRQFLLDNRTHRGVAGYHVLTPLRRGPNEPGVIVDRGWVPVGESRARLPELPLEAVRSSVRGTVRFVSAGAFLLGSSGYENVTWPKVVQHVDLGEMSRALDYPLLPYVLLLDEIEPDGFVREWPVYHGISADRHRAYAFQWFALALAVAVVYFAVNMRRPSVVEGNA